MSPENPDNIFGGVMLVSEYENPPATFFFYQSIDIFSLYFLRGPIERNRFVRPFIFRRFRPSRFVPKAVIKIDKELRTQHASNTNKKNHFGNENFYRARSEIDIKNFPNYVHFYTKICTSFCYFSLHWYFFYYHQ